MGNFKRLLVFFLLTLSLASPKALANDLDSRCRLNSIYEAVDSDLTFNASSGFRWQGNPKSFVPSCLDAARQGSYGFESQGPSYFGRLVSTNVEFLHSRLSLTGQVTLRKGLTVGLSPRCHIVSRYLSADGGFSLEAEGSLSFEFTPEGSLSACVEQAMVGIGPQVDQAIFRNMIFTGSQVSFSVDSYDFEGRVAVVPSGEL